MLGSGRKANPLALLLFDMLIQFTQAGSERMFSSEMVERLRWLAGRPWSTLLRGKPIDERWLGWQLS